MRFVEFIEENLRTKNPCWSGYKPVGTKKKNGRTVPNCVPKESIDKKLQEGESTKAGIVQTEVYGTKAYHAKCMEPNCDWQSKRYDRIKQAQVAAQKHAEKHVGKKDVAEGFTSLSQEFD